MIYIYITRINLEIFDVCTYKIFYFYFKIHLHSLIRKKWINKNFTRVLCAVLPNFVLCLVGFTP